MSSNITINPFANLSKLPPRYSKTHKPIPTASVFLHRTPDNAQARPGYELFPNSLPSNTPYGIIAHHELIFDEIFHAVKITTGFALSHYDPHEYNVSTLTLEEGKYSVQEDRFENEGNVRVLVLRRKTGETFKREHSNSMTGAGKSLEPALDAIPERNLNWMKYVTIRIENVKTFGMEQWYDEGVKKTLSTIPRRRGKETSVTEDKSPQGARNDTAKTDGKASQVPKTISPRLTTQVAANRIEARDPAAVTRLTERIRNLRIVDLPTSSPAPADLETSMLDLSSADFQDESESYVSNPSSPSAPNRLSPNTDNESENTAIIALALARAETRKLLAASVEKAREEDMDWDNCGAHLSGETMEVEAEAGWDDCDVSLPLAA